LIQLYFKYLTFILILVHFHITVYSQNFAESGINLGVKFGGSKLLGEIPYDFSDLINEFGNKTGFASAFEISKNISNHWEIGSEYGYTSLKGSTSSPEFSAEGFHQGIPSEITEPVEYVNILIGQNFFFRYFFKPAGSESAFIPFIRAGAGYLNYNSKFKYIDAPDNDLLFGKGTEGYTKLSTPVYFIGIGFKTSIASQFYLVSAIDFNMVNYDFLDVMHNFDLTGSRLELIGLYTELKIGIYYNFSKSGGGRKNKKSRSSNSGFLPFSR